MKYKDWLNIWLEHYVKTSSKQRTYERYLQTSSAHIIPSLGEYEISELQPIVLQQFISKLLECGNKRTGNGLSPNFVKLIISVLQNSLKSAYTFGINQEYIADKIKRPKIFEKQVECFSLNEQKRIEQYILGHSKPKLRGIILCLYTGLRIGELLALTWSDIDFHNALLSVTKTCHDGNINGKHCVIVDTPKTENSQRDIPLSKPIITLLREMKKQGTSNFVIEDKQTAVFVRSYQRTFELLLKRLDIPHKGFHALRHTFATRALECGMDIKTLSEILGHKNATITLNRYAHSLWEHKSEMMNKLGKLL
ncbi:MAG: site-specific integrase [Clostridia bacterium]|nr:site-specific integrase [Clostridia bacterium]